MAGIPPFNGFLSKEMFFTAVLNASKMTVFNGDYMMLFIPIIAWIASVFTFVYSMILVFKTFRGKNKPEKLGREVHEAPIGMLIPPIVLGFLVILIFFFPNVLSHYLLKPALAAVLPTLAQAGELNVKISAWHGWNAELFMTIGVIGIGTLIVYLFEKVVPNLSYLSRWANIK